MGLVERFGRMQSCGKKQCRSLFWRIRAAMKKKKTAGSKPQFKFQYDPYSYALNFDDGFIQEIAERKREFNHLKFLGCPEKANAIWIYVLWQE